MEKNKQNFLKELAARNVTPQTSVRTIAPYQPAQNLRGIHPFCPLLPPCVFDDALDPLSRRASLIKYYMSPAVFLPKILGSSPEFRKPTTLAMSGSYEGIRSPMVSEYSAQFPFSPSRARPRHEGTGSNALLMANLMEMFANDPDRQKKVQDIINALVGKLVRVANLDEIMKNLDTVYLRVFVFMFYTYLGVSWWTVQ